MSEIPDQASAEADFLDAFQHQSVDPNPGNPVAVEAVQAATDATYHAANPSN